MYHPLRREYRVGLQELDIDDLVEGSEVFGNFGAHNEGDTEGRLGSGAPVSALDSADHVMGGDAGSEGTPGETQMTFIAQAANMLKCWTRESGWRLHYWTVPKTSLSPSILLYCHPKQMYSLLAVGK